MSRATGTTSALATPALGLFLLGATLVRVVGGERRAIGQSYCDGVCDFFSHLVAHLIPDHQLKENASFELFDRVNDLLTSSGGSSPLGVNSSRRRDLDLEIRFSEPTLPCDGTARFQYKLLCRRGTRPDTLRCPSRLSRSL